ncbi:uncharacterized protein DSM5745_03357 [Aspergillus mulundensis]|uniref:Uncharacterized protein n=1 Tax=Aspergillus mulundensis TaxID=1810919 RepID=A0A3D8SK52_9EURO|nr:Uncharacterized protein DSM5745_03357 [Aspergillus mulundensis]RDW86715.1 Uncharacterized protein DSM5745_03357 [Aspergillus mulundensis]
MSATTTRHPLTKRNLAILDRLLQSKHTTGPITSWAEKVISEEQLQLLCSQPRTALSGKSLLTGDSTTETTIERDMDLSTQGVRIPSIAATTTTDPFKIFEDGQRPFMCLESPLERYLTPGSSEPSYFSRSALAQVGLQYGDMEGKRERADIARGHLETVRDNALQAREQAGK